MRAAVPAVVQSLSCPGEPPVGSHGLLDLPRPASLSAAARWPLSALILHGGSALSPQVNVSDTHTPCPLLSAKSEFVFQLVFPA